MSAGLLQLLLGRRLELTPAILAYSLLYPYSDNVLDDPKLSTAAKIAFNQRFRCRLAGQPLAAAGEREAVIDRLVSMVEDQYDRRTYPQVFASLLAIHAAQTRSLELMRAGAAPYEVDLLGVTFDKGGTSVLADAYLVAGELTAQQETFAFELGAFLQFVDDLEDVETDLAAGRLSVFALAARGALVLTAGRVRRRYTRAYWRELESHAPFRFAFVDRLSGKLSRKIARSLPRLATANLDRGPAASGCGRRTAGAAVSPVV